MVPKILLINPPYTSIVGIVDSGGHAVPLNLCYIAAFLKENLKVEVSILDCEISMLNYEEIKKKIIEERPDIVGITCPTPVFNHVKRITNIVKKINPKTKVVLGGSHPSALPKCCIKPEPVDFLIRGEGEITFKELVEAISKGQTNFSKIDGLVYKNKNKIIINKPRKYIENLDDLPFPDRDLVNMDEYYSAPTKKVSDKKSTSILTGRGCPYNCIHCMSKVVWGQKYRFRSPKNIVDEIEFCNKKYGMEEFNFYDDTFTINKTQVLAVCDEIIKRNLNIYWICFTRVNTISPELVKKMKRAGCKKISIGLESGSNKILKLMRKNATVEMARKAVKIINKEKIKVHAGFMLGNVGETKETVLETINFAKSLPLDNATFFITSPFPGTDLYEIAKKKGYINKNTKWEEFAPITNLSPILVQDNLSKKELVKYQKKAFRKFYLRPTYVFRKLFSIKSFEEFKSLFEGVLIFLRVQKK